MWMARTLDRAASLVRSISAWSSRGFLRFTSSLVSVLLCLVSRLLVSVSRFLGPAAPPSWSPRTTHTTAVVLRLANVRFSLLLVCFSSVFPLLSSVDESARPCLHIVIAPTCCHTNVVLTLFLNLTVTLTLPPARLPPFRISLHRNCISRCHTVYIYIHIIFPPSPTLALASVFAAAADPPIHIT